MSTQLALTPEPPALRDFEPQPGLLDDFPTMVWVSSLAGQLSYVNKAWLQFTGRTLALELGNGWTDGLHPQDKRRIVRELHDAMAKRRPFELEYRLRRHDGVYRWLLGRGSPTCNGADERVRYVGFCYDTTERRVSDAAHLERAEQVRLLGLATRDMVWSWDARSDRVLHNVAFGEALGDLPGPLGVSIAWWKERVHPDDRERIVAIFAQAAAEQRADLCYEYRFRRKDGVYAVIDDRVCFERDINGKVVRVLGAMRDITDRKRAEKSQERFVRILETTSDFVGMADANGGVLYINRAGRQLLGWPLEGPLTGRRLSDAHPAWANEIVLHAAIPAAIREGTWAGETALLAIDGREIPVSQVIISHSGAQGTVEFISTIMRDISDRKREEVARIEWANRYDAAIRASGQLLFDWNSFTNDITYAGDVEHLLGYTMRELAGGLERFRQLIHAGDLAAFDDEIARVIATRDPFHVGFRVLRKDRSEIVIDAKGYFFLDRQGHIGRMVGFFADVTAQVRAQEELALAHNNLEARVEERTAELARTYVVIQDRALQQETVAYLGQRALAGAQLEALFDEAVLLIRTTLKVDLCSVLQLTPDGGELVVRGSAGWPGHTVGRRVPVENESQSGYTLLVGEPVIVEEMGRETRFNISQPVREIGAVSGISVTVQAGNEPMGVLCALTMQRRAFTVDDVHFLRSIANVLTAAIDRRAAEESIRLAQAQAESANRAKSEFLSRMSHELRTPLNAILGFTQLLELDKLSPSQSESIKHISRAGDHLLLLINEVLDIARIEAGRLALSPERIEMTELLAGVVDLMRPLAARHDVQLVLDANSGEAHQVFADRQRLRQVLLNLLSNAVKYNRASGRVVVSCVAVAGGRLRINVCDNGHGISPEKIERLFIPFERLGAEGTRIEGTGIGLALSQRIVTALDGELGVDSTVGEGTTFWIELRATELPAPEPVESGDSSLDESTPSASRRRTILYVENQDLNLRLVERLLTRRPEYTLLSAMQGGLALDLAREHRPDLILLDLDLPDMPGEDVLRRLKADPELRGIPVVTVSADATADRVQELLALGASGYLTKPYYPGEFFRALEGVMA